MEQIHSQIIALIFIEAILLISPVVFISLDFWAGIRKAKHNNIPIRSDKMQRTIQKVSRYYNAILAMVALDIIQIAGFIFLHIYNNWTLYTFPIFTLLAIFFVAAIEVKSIMEPADKKEAKEMEAVLALAKEIAKHRQEPDELAKAIVDYINNQEDGSKLKKRFNGE